MSITKTNAFDLVDFSENSIFILDTNVLYYVHSGYYQPAYSKSIAYSNLIQTIIAGGKEILVSALSIQELLYGIENKEYKLYLSTNGLAQNAYTKKDFRGNSLERAKLKLKMRTILTEISSFYKLVDGAITCAQVEQYVNHLDTHRYDPIDYALVDGTGALEQVVFISDDSDFIHDSKIELVTQ